MMQATERKFCISCSESIKKGKNSQTWANPCSVHVSFAGQRGSAGLRHLSWLQPQQQLPSPHWNCSLGGSRALGWAGAVPSVMAGACETPYGGKDLSTTEGPMVLGSSPSKVCVWLPSSALPAWPSTRDEPPRCDRTGRDSPAGEVPPLGRHQGPPGPQGCACCNEQGQTVAHLGAHSGPLTDSCSKVLTLNSGSCLALQGWRAAEGLGAEAVLTCCSETCTHKCTF